MSGRRKNVGEAEGCLGEVRMSDRGKTVLGRVRMYERGMNV